METKRAPALQPQMTTQLLADVTVDPPDVSVVISCLHEANSLGLCIEKAHRAFRDAGLRGEGVVGDNGSSDGPIVFSYAERFDRNTVSLKRVLKRASFETGLLLGGSLFLMGLAGCAYITWQWAASGFGALAQVRGVLFWSLWLFLAVQIIFSSFFLSMLGISRGAYIGDCDLPTADK